MPLQIRMWADLRRMASTFLCLTQPRCSNRCSHLRWELTRPLESPDRPSAADFVFDKRVMLRSDWDQTLSCSGAVDALTVYYSTTVTYCYIFTNVGTTTFVTHTFTDDKLGSLSPFKQNVIPNGQIGFVGLPPYGLAQNTTNTATWTAIDQNGTTIARTDQVTVKVVMPLTGYVYLDQNSDGVRNSGETTGIGGVQLRLESRPPDTNKARQTWTFSTGYYQFLDAVAGVYTVSVVLPAGYVATSPTDVPVTLVFGVNKVVSFRRSDGYTDADLDRDSHIRDNTDSDRDCYP